MRTLGLRAFRIRGQIFLAVVGWVELNQISPQATKYLSAFALMGVCVFSLIAAGALQSRENARRNQVRNNLRLLGNEMQLQRYDDRAQDVGQPASGRLVADEMAESD